MANPEHLEILKQGVDVWNAWRQDQRKIVPDLRGAELRGAQLTHANLIRTKLIRAKLSSADLTYTKLSGARLMLADLRGANLRGAELINADLFSANLGDADFSDTDLRGAVLKSADLRNAKLRGASLLNATFDNAKLGDSDFTDARMAITVLVNVDLSQVKGLEAVRHGTRSRIGIDTIYKSQGHIPEVFLRGCGVPESFIVQIPALVAAMQPIEFYSCFISYSSKDQEFADRLYADLQNKGVRCWFAPHDLKIGDRFRDRIDESIRLHDKLLLILSASSVSSQWVGAEVEAAFEQEQREDHTVLFPIRIDDAVMDSEKAWAATIRRARHVGNFTDWKDHDSYRKAFDRLLRDLRAEEKKA
jgi:hypothetical protein